MTNKKLTKNDILFDNMIFKLRKIWNDQQYFKRRGIPGPKYSFIFGNTVTLRVDKVFQVVKLISFFHKLYLLLFLNRMSL